jgi:catechol 2,3-dioxygenase-like lactoylglutathione lyase family enzyme
MNRLHVHVAVRDIDESIRFYSRLFNAEPTVTKPDYAKWMLDDPRVNFAISMRDATPGISHLGIQAEDAEKLGEITARLKAAEASLFQEQDAPCCYARYDKTWVEDPQGVRWENFSTHGTIANYGFDSSPDQAKQPSRDACGCAPA